MHKFTINQKDFNQLMVEYQNELMNDYKPGRTIQKRVSEFAESLGETFEDTYNFIGAVGEICEEYDKSIDDLLPLINDPFYQYLFFKRDCYPEYIMGFIRSGVLTKDQIKELDDRQLRRYGWYINRYEYWAKELNIWSFEKGVDGLTKKEIEDLKRRNPSDWVDEFKKYRKKVWKWINNN